MEKIRLLYLCNKKYWDFKMSRVRFHSVDSIIKHENIIGFKDGPGFSGWKNIPNSIKKYNPDIIFWYKPLEMEGYQDVNIPRVISYNEMYDIASTESEILKSDSRLIIHHLSNEVQNYKSLTSLGFKFKNIPHCVEKNIFKDYKEKKAYDILLAGQLSDSIYPIRGRLKKIIESGRFSKYKAKILKHPGYKIKNVDEQVISYARELNKSKLVVTCSSIYKYALAKYVEVPACNSLLVADLPDDRVDFFNKFIVKIDNKMSDSEICDIILYWINNEKERCERSSIGMNLIKENYTQEDYANIFYKTIEEYI